MGPFTYEEEISSENFLAWCVRDSAQLKSDFLTYRPCYQGQPPALWVEPLLGSILLRRVDHFPHQSLFSETPNRRVP